MVLFCFAAGCKILSLKNNFLYDQLKITYNLNSLSYFYGLIINIFLFVIDPRLWNHHQGEDGAAMVEYFNYQKQEQDQEHE